ncbi:TIGR03503 family protein [Pseudoalteromonas ruthenica]|uniref:TIGR03503 family protein n=1 Tax=Pseudoalteromonas ruthenica TaxID=151081 RepID=UPI001109204E|nr:TIGR03503 family protein [Pseudoalteromonas ruthenica]TLX50586.1 TIGR03503 family protein [Pseudoalteromonas ruthenica]
MAKLILISMVLLLGVGVSAPALGDEQEKLTVLAEGNEIPLLDNRFRIDHDVDKITLLFFRRQGSPAVVLVRPDGSKIYATHSLNDDNLQWHDELGYDLIVLNKPMPGPWQVVGQILPDSRIMVIGDISLQVDELPPLLFRGEIIKLTGKVLNDGEQVKIGRFRDVINMQVDFVSTNNNEYSNFGARTEHVANFKDDGRGFDERPGDAIFTGEFRLDFAAGQWRPEIALTTPIIQRKVVQEPVVVKDPPLTYELHEGAKGESHELHITLDEQLLDPQSVLLQGKIFYPNNDEQAFSLPAEQDNTRVITISNYEWGRYSLQIELYGTNSNGREFMAALPDYEFAIARPIEKVEEIAPPVSQGPTELAEQSDQPSAMSNALFYSLVVLGNMFILLAGWAAIRVLVQKKPLLGNINLLFWKKKSAQSDEQETNSSEANSDKNGSKSDKSGEILNLSMSDD